MTQSGKKSMEGSILIADDHGVLLYGLSRLLSDNLRPERILEAKTLAECQTQFETPDLKLAIIDLGMPGASGYRWLNDLRLKRPDVLLVILSASDSRTDIVNALGAGVHGYIVKNERPCEIISHLRHVLGGGIYVPPAIANSPECLPEPDRAKGAPVLTRRQREVLELLIAGKTNKQIGAELDVGPGTIKMHVSKMLKVVDARNRAQLAAKGRELLRQDGKQK